MILASVMNQKALSLSSLVFMLSTIVVDAVFPVKVSFQEYLLLQQCLEATRHSFWKTPCKEGEKIPSNSDCSKYYVCHHGHYTEMICTPPLHFNPVIGSCDWQSNAGCDSKPDTSKPSPPSPVTPGTPEIEATDMPALGVGEDSTVVPIITGDGGNTGSASNPGLPGFPGEEDILG